jgi:thiopeptide-type bacteriocin biosynthesis protein
MGRDRAALYRAGDFFMVRAPLLPIDADPSDHVARDLPREVDCAIAVASTQFFDAMHASTAAARSPEVARALRRYLVRMSTRPTPFGLFAGVELGSWGDETDLGLAAGTRRLRTRPDMAWLARIVHEAESDPRVRRHLRVVANRAAFLRAGRVVLAERVSRGEPRAAAVSIRATGVVRRVLDAAATPIAYEALAARALAGTPGATADQIEGLLAELCEQTLLLTDLRPPLTVASPARHVLDRLASIPAAGETAAALGGILNAAAEWDATPSATRYRALVEQATALAPSDRSPLHVDSTLQLSGRTVARSVADETARAGELLLRLSPIPDGPPYLAAFRRMFERRYGQHREVALLELLDPNVGLGAPPFQHAGDAASQRRSWARGRILLELAATAARERRRWVELDERLLERLHPAELGAENAPASLDLQVVVAAASPAALDAGDFRLLIGSNVGSLAAGRTLGRFADVLPEAPSALGRIAAAEEAADPGRLWVELTYAPRSPRLANVCIRPNVRGHEIAVGVGSGLESGRTIPVDELVVGVRGGRFYVRWQHAEQELAITAGHMLNHARAPLPCRFLSAVGRDGMCQLTGWQWGPASALPFLPRVQHGRVVLALARWQISASSLPAAALRDRAAFVIELERWRARWDVPQHVALTSGDRPLPLDLATVSDADELREALRRGSDTAVVTELFGDREHAWLQDGDGRRFASELIVPLIRRARAAAPAPMRPHRRSAAPSALSDLRPVGSDWLFLKLYCGRDVEDDLLTGPLREFVTAATADGFGEWFFIRYGDPARHVRLRFRGAPERLVSELLPRVCAWASGLVEDGTCLRFSLDTYEREIERFGGPEAATAAETFFAADSRAVLELLPRLRRKDAVLPPMALASLTIEAVLGGLGLDREAQARWCDEHSPNRFEAGEDYRAWKGLLRPLLVEPAGVPGEVGDVLRDVRTAAVALRDSLDDLASANRLTRAPHELSGSVVHLHLNRLLAADSSLERRVIGLLGRVQHGLAMPRGAARR